MKLLRYGARGQERPGILDNEGRIRDLSAHIDDVAGKALTPESLMRLKAIDTSLLPFVEGTPRLGPCVGKTGKFIGIGLNYADHAAELGVESPAEPTVFGKWTSSICGANDDIEIPQNAMKADWEVELGIIIGKAGRYIREPDALEHVAGYCVVNDISEREWQMERGGLWDKGKGCDTFGPIGPWLVTADDVGDVNKLSLWLDVNGHRFQSGSTSKMIFGIAFIISYVSRFLSLQSGDIITTGTPPGVGMGQKPPVYLKSGDVMTLGIEGLGVQHQKVVAATEVGESLATGTRIAHVAS